MRHAVIARRIDEVAEKAVVLFQQEGWTWWGDSTPPNKEKIKHNLWRMVDHLLESEKSTAMESGRFRIEKEDWQADEPYLGFYLLIGSHKPAAPDR